MKLVSSGLDVRERRLPSPFPRGTCTPILFARVIKASSCASIAVRWSGMSSGLGMHPQLLRRLSSRAFGWRPERTDQHTASFPWSRSQPTVKIEVSTPLLQISTLLNPFDCSMRRVLSEGQKTMSHRSCKLRDSFHIVDSSHDTPNKTA